MALPCQATFRTSAAKTSLLDSLKLAFGPDINLTDNLNIKAGVNAPDFSVLGSVLKEAVDIPDFNFDLNGDTLTLPAPHRPKPSKQTSKPRQRLHGQT